MDEVRCQRPTDERTVVRDIPGTGNGNTICGIQKPFDFRIVFVYRRGEDFVHLEQGQVTVIPKQTLCMDLAPETLLLDTEDRITTVTINRPEKRNALNSLVLDELREVFEVLQEDDDVGGIILTGAGEKAFVAGADIAELNKLRSKSGERASQKGQSVFTLIESTGKPVIAAVEGYALGGGCELALACHLRVAAKNAQFGLPELGLGVMPGYGGTQRLPRLIGKGRALEMMLDGSPIDADKAFDYGLVNRVVENGSAAGESRNWLRHILTRGPLAIKKVIQSVHAAYPNRAQGFQEESRMFGYLCGTGDFKEGTTAFLEKRKPGFQNK